MDPQGAVEGSWLTELGAWKRVRWKEGKCAQDAGVRRTEGGHMQPGSSELMGNGLWSND